MRSLVLATVFAGALAAQATDAPRAAEPLDLAALAKQLDPGATPTVLDLVPAALVERSNRVLEGVPAAAIDEVLRWSEACDGVVLCAAIGVLQSDEARATPADLLREIFACWWIGRFGAGRDFLDRNFGSGGDAGWEKAAKEPALRRARALGARLLREHGKDAAATELLARLGDLDAATTWRMRDEVIRRLGDRATTFDWLQHARAALVNLDLERAEASVRAAYRAGVLPSAAARRYVAQGLFELRRRLLDAKQHTESAKQPGFSGQIAKLRLLQAANPDAAVDESRQLATASVAHALPFSILASAAAVEGRRDEALAYLAQAAQCPGRDALAASLELTLRTLPQWRELQQRPAEEVRKKVAAALQECDAVVAEDNSEPAVLYRWERKVLHWLEPSATGRADLGAAQALQASLPDSLAAYKVLLAAALLTDDAAKARAVLLHPVPSALAALHDIAWLRASIYVVRDLREDRAPVPAELDALLGDLERVQQDPADASYLRGVRTWWEATRIGADEKLRRKAREFFASGQPEFGQRRLWRSASALCVVDAARGEPVDFNELLRASTREELSNRSSLVALPTLGFADPRIDKDSATQWARWLSHIDHEGSLAVVQSACADARRRLGDSRGARDAAIAALKASAGDGPTRLPLDRGIVVSGEYRSGLGFKLARATFDPKLENNLWVVPRVMNREQLQQIVDGK